MTIVSVESDDPDADVTVCTAFDAERFVLANLSLRVHGGTVRSRNGVDQGLVYVLARPDARSLAIFGAGDEARSHLAKGDLKSAYNAARLKFRAPGMQDAALLRVREGVTSLEEVARVFAPPAAKPAAGAKPAATAAKPAAAGAKPTQPPKPKA